MKICTKCNKEKRLKDFYYHRTRKHYAGSCKTCNSKQCKEYQQNGYRDTEKYVFYQRAYKIKHDARFKKVPCMDKLKEHLISLWNKSKLCAYTGLEMSLTGYHSSPYAMTVDRKIPKLGYTEGNVVLCCSMANRMKQNNTPEELVKWCNMIVTHCRQRS